MRQPLASMIASLTMPSGKRYGHFLSVFIFAAVSFFLNANSVVDAIIQEEPLEISANVQVIGTSFESAKDGDNLTIDIPLHTETGDLLVMFVAGSASGKKIPSRPGKEWTLIFEEGEEDLNLKAYYKIAESQDFATIQVPTADNSNFVVENIFDVPLQLQPDLADSWKISDGKNTFVSLLALRGIDLYDPIVDSAAIEDSRPGREGDAKAPSVRTEEGGIVLACFAYDDPHQAIVTTKGFEMLLSTDSGTGDGLAVAASPTNGDPTGSIDATGTSYERGGGDDIASTISFRSSSHPPPISLRGQSTSTPTITPSLWLAEEGVVFSYGKQSAVKQMGLLRKCHGDCNIGRDCEGSLVCFERDEEPDSTVWGCIGEALDPDEDFCVDPADLPSSFAEDFDTNTLFAVRLAPLIDVRLDPIVNPGTCSSHIHSVFGAASFGKIITDFDLQSPVETSANVLPNRSLYWTPSLYIYDPSSQLYHIVPTYARAYYRFNEKFLPSTRTFPLNFRVVVGDAKRKAKYKPWEPRDDISWTQKGTRRVTNSQEHSSWDDYIEEFGYRTDPEEYLEMNINFPECIAVDGSGNPLLDSEDHRSHMAYVERTEPCPASHPFRVPKVNLEVRYELDRMVDRLGKDVVQDSSNWFLSQGDHTGAAAHADFISGWDEAVLEESIRDCRGGDAESGCILTQFFDNSRAEDRAKRVALLKEDEFPDEVVSPLKELILVPDGSCSVSTSTTNIPSKKPSTEPSPSPSSSLTLTTPPSITPRMCNTAKERKCRAKCFDRRGCGSDVSSSCHSLCRHKCCNDVSQDDTRLCNTPLEKECRSKCFHNQNCGTDEACKTKCRQRCCS